MQGALARFDRAATDLVQSTSGASDASPEAAVIESLEATLEFRANAAAMRAAHQMLGALLDIRV